MISFLDSYQQIILLFYLPNKFFNAAVPTVMQLSPPTSTQGEKT